MKLPSADSYTQDHSVRGLLPVDWFPVLLDMILGYLALAQLEKKLFSNVSMTCKRWSKKLRPLLFGQLILESISDVQYLAAALCTPTSSWLAPHVLRLTLRSPPKSPDSFQFSSPSWKRLFRLLPSLNHVHVFMRHNASDRLFPWKERVFLRSLRSLRRLKLDNVRFFSSSSIVRLIGSMPFLEGVTLKGVEWGGSADTEQAPQHSPPLRHLQFLALNSCSNSVVFAWAFAATSLRHTLRRDGNGNPAPIPTEMATVVQLVDVFAAGTNPYILYQRQKAEEGAMTYSLTAECWLNASDSRRVYFHSNDRQTNDLSVRDATVYGTGRPRRRSSMVSAGNVACDRQTSQTT